jgi:hypothetical protein
MIQIRRGFFFLNVLFLVCIIASGCLASAGTVNVKSFGAKGNGTADDTEALRKAFASLAKTGGTIYFPAGVYLTDIIDIRPEKGMSITVSGAGVGSVVKLGAKFVKPIAVFFCEVPGVKLSFNQLTVDGNYMNRTRAWKTTASRQIEPDQQVNGIFAYNVYSLNVTDCSIRAVHGDAIACYSAEKLTANKNVIENVSGTGIKGHRVISMEVNYNRINNTGLLTDTYVLDGQTQKFLVNGPNTKFGDGIEAESQTFNATYNKIVNPGRCGIVHDLAQDLKFTNSRASVSNNTITINSVKINSNNPPAGMWFEQTATVAVTNNTVSIIKSGNKITSAIRFYDITESIVCSNNKIQASTYNQISDNAIGIFEPRTSKMSITANRITGRFKSALAVSYENKASRVGILYIKQNTIQGNKRIDNGISISISGKNKFPDQTEIAANTLLGLNAKPFDWYYYGDIDAKRAPSVITVSGNTTDKGFSNLKLIAPKGVTISSK